MPQGNTDSSNSTEESGTERYRRARESQKDAPGKKDERSENTPGDKKDRDHVDEDDSREAMHRGFIGDVKERFERDAVRGDTGYAEKRPKDKETHK